jgi:tripartite-type tricarboxylate transporter receptor subunit TctC
VRIIAAAAAGSGPDIISRLAGGKLTESWKQQVVIDNRAGAGGNLGAEIAARAAPDGYTLLMLTASQPIAVSLFPKLNYDLMRDFAPVTLLASTPYILAVHPAVPANNITELIAHAKSRPRDLRYGSGGSGSPPHLAAEMLRVQAGIDMLHVPYKSIAPALTELMAGQVHLAFSVVSAIVPHVKSGKLRALAVTSAKRTPLAPEWPALSESLAGYQFSGWYGLMAPTGTPRAVIKRIHADATRAVRDADIRERLTTLGAEARGVPPAEFGAFVRAEIERLGKAVRDSGARPD